MSLVENIRGLPVRSGYCDTCNYRPDCGRLMGPVNETFPSYKQAGWLLRDLKNLPAHECHTNPTEFVCFGSINNRNMSRDQMMVIIEKRMGLCLPPVSQREENNARSRRKNV